MAIAQHQVPKKLTAGMAVVVYFPKPFPFMSWERVAGINHKVWIKAKLHKIRSDGWIGLIIKGQLLAVGPNDKVILVRSTSWDDSDAKVRAEKRNAARSRK